MTTTHSAATSAVCASQARRWRKYLLIAGVLGALAVPSLVVLPDHAWASHDTTVVERAPPASIELVEVPFHPQEEYQCGPAALAMTLNWSGVSVTPDELKDAVYSPARRGSLPNDLIAAARRHGRLAYTVHALDDVLKEVAAGHPVIALQTLGEGAEPRWHYSVVIGYDRPAETLLLRSGRDARKVISFAVFEASWQAGDNWALVVLEPSELPATAEESAFVEAASGLEAAQHPDSAAIAYEAALKRWPESLGAWIGLGNSRYALHDLSGAERAFRKASELHPGSGSALNNLALVLAAEGRKEEALSAARQAVAKGGPLAATFQQTLETLEGGHNSAARHAAFDQSSSASQAAERSDQTTRQDAPPRGRYDGRWKGKAVFDGGAKCTGWLSIDMVVKDSEISGRWHVEGNPVGAGDYRLIGMVGPKGQLIDTTASRGYVGKISGWLSDATGRGGFSVQAGSCMGVWNVTKAKERKEARITAEAQPRVTAEEHPHVANAATHDAKHQAPEPDERLEQRLRKLQQLVSLGLITPEDAAQKRREMLHDF